MSSAIWWLVLGVLIGWLIEWVIDWVYWRRRSQARAEGAQAGQQADAELARLRDALASTRANNEKLQADLQVATTSAQERQTTIDELTQRLAHAEAGNTRLAADTEVPRAPAVLSADEHSAEASTFAPMQPLREDSASPAPPDAIRVATGPKTNDTLLLHEIEVPQSAERRRDPLIDINGIGPVYERKLFDAGVYTFEDLAALTPERVQAIIAPQRWQEIDSASWIAKARQLAQKKAQP